MLSVAVGPSPPPSQETTASSFGDDGVLDDWARDMVKGVCCTVAVLGGVGNLLTLFAVPYASRCCRAPLEVKRLRYSTATVFILNLAVADLLYCLVNLPLYYSQYNRPEVWKNSLVGCRAAGLMRYMNAAADWMSLAGIALNRCVCLLSFKWKGRIFGGWKSHVIIIFIWLYGFLTQGLSLFGLYGEYGWNNETHKCDFLRTMTGAQPRTDWFLISWSIPCVIIVVCYTLIFIKVKQSGRSILQKNHNMEHVQALLKTREDKTSRMIFVVFITYCACALPITVINVADPQNVHQYLSITFYCIYWLQYCCNNIIYVFSNSVYRQAYIIFLTEVIPPLKQFLRPPGPWQPRQSTITTITGGRFQSRSFTDTSRRIRHNDSLVSQMIVSGDSSSRDGAASSSPTSQPTASSASPGGVAGGAAARWVPGACSRRLGLRQGRPPPRRAASLSCCAEASRQLEPATRRLRLARHLRRRLGGRRRTLPLEKQSAHAGEWRPLDDGTLSPADAGWRSASLLDVRLRQDGAAGETQAARRTFCRGDSPRVSAAGGALGNKPAAKPTRRTLFRRKRSMSF